MKFVFSLTLFTTATVEANDEEAARDLLDQEIAKYKVMSDRLDTNKAVKVNDFDEYESSPDGGV